jgi:rubredoxin
MTKSEKTLNDYIIVECEFCGHRYAENWGLVLFHNPQGLKLGELYRNNACPRCGVFGDGVVVEDVFGRNK